MLAFCLGEMGLAPGTVWQATPREIALMIRGRRGGTAAASAPARADFAELLDRYPDNPT